MHQQEKNTSIPNGKKTVQFQIKSFTLQEIHISHLGKFGKSSTQICQTSGGYVNSLVSVLVHLSLRNICIMKLSCSFRNISLKVTIIATAIGQPVGILRVFLLLVRTSSRTPPWEALWNTHLLCPSTKFTDRFQMKPINKKTPAAAKIC